MALLLSSMATPMSILALLLLLVLQAPSIAMARAKASSSDYLYAGKEDTRPIMDYVKPKQNNPSESNADYNNRLLEPPYFLTNRFDKPRVVEFYAPWCGVSFCLVYHNMTFIRAQGMVPG